MYGFSMANENGIHPATFTEVRALLNDVGVEMMQVTCGQAETELSGVLYAQVASAPGREGCPVYVGKTHRTDGNMGRPFDEIKWARQARLSSHLEHALFAVLLAHECSPQVFRVSEDRGRLLEMVEQWNGLQPLRQRLERPEPLSLRELEQLLIRLCVRTGNCLANVHYAGGWESSTGGAMDGLATIAASRYWGREFELEVA